MLLQRLGSTECSQLEDRRLVVRSAGDMLFYTKHSGQGDLSVKVRLQLQLVYLTFRHNDHFVGCCSTIF